MRIILQCEALPEDTSPVAWLEHVLPRPREAYQRQYASTRDVLTNAAFDKEATFFAADDRGPVGLVVVTGTGPKRRVEFIGVRGDRRYRGLGKALLDRAISAVRDEGALSLSTSGVSSQNTATVHLLNSLGFTGQSGGGIRMRRLLDLPLPVLEIPDGFTLRALQEGEEAAWVNMMNACFKAEQLNWGVEDFRRQFMEHPIFDFGRVFVMLHDGCLVGTASAWEADFGEGAAGLIHWVGVVPDFRRKGVGITLSVRALEELAARGYLDAWLNTSRKRAAAVHLYERLGFEVHREMYTYTLSLS